MSHIRKSQNKKGLSNFPMFVDKNMRGGGGHYYPQVLRCLYLAYERIYATLHAHPNRNERGLSKIPVFVYRSQGGKRTL